MSVKILTSPLGTVANGVGHFIHVSVRDHLIVVGAPEREVDADGEGDDQRRAEDDVVDDAERRCRHLVVCRNVGVRNFNLNQSLRREVSIPEMLSTPRSKMDCHVSCVSEKWSTGFLSNCPSSSVECFSMQFDVIRCYASSVQSYATLAIVTKSN